LFDGNNWKLIARDGTPVTEPSQRWALH
jgi:hypothetical protein